MCPAWCVAGTCKEGQLTHHFIPGADKLYEGLQLARVLLRILQQPGRCKGDLLLELLSPLLLLLELLQPAKPHVSCL